MKVKFFANRHSGRFPDLTDGKVYEADEDTIEVNGETRYYVYDDDDDEDPTPYPISVFDVVEEEKGNDKA
jgi:hypothetical protein